MKKETNLPAAPRADIPVIAVEPTCGLSAAQVEQRQRGGWANTAPADTGRTEKQIILHNCLTFFNFVFITLALVLLVCGSTILNASFLLIAIINTVIGCFQEIRAKRAVDELTLVAAQTVKVIRDGKLQGVRSDKLVRDDIVEFGAGDQICADAVVRAGELQVNESLITGEADAITKHVGDELKSGSFVIAGRAHAQLTHVGADAFAAKLSSEAKADPKATKSEMMLSLDRLIKVVGFALIPIGIAMFIQLYTRQQLSLTSSAERTVAALTGMIPEGLYLLTSVAMAASALKLTRARVLVQDLNCIETLARVDVLCVDKTGTITEPHMEVSNVLPLGDHDPERLEAVLTALYGGEEPENETARALHELFGGESGWVCTRRIPFTSAAKWSGGVFQDHGAFLVGAPEFILKDRYHEIADDVSPWTDTGYRVLLVASYAGEPQPGALDTAAVTPMALILLTNRIREEAPDTFRYFAGQQVAIKVISGDNPATVSDVARRAGIADAERYIDAGELETEADFLHAVETYTVFGRVTPDKKRALIRALKKQKHTVAMTGDGVNDVLAMKEADCGIAMASGAQAASQVAQLVLLDSDFSVMPSIVGEGRRVINNIQRAATLFLVKNIFSLALSIIGFFTNWPYPLVPLHLTVISALTIGVPSFFLAMEPNYARVNSRFLAGVLRRAFPGGLTNIFVVLTAQAFMAVFALPLEEISTVCAAILCFVGLLVLYQVCKPFDWFRRLIWGSMAVALIVCFTALGSVFALRAGSWGAQLLMATLLIMTPTVFFAIQRVFDVGDRIIAYCRIHRRHVFRDAWRSLRAYFARLAAKKEKNADV